MLLSNNLAGGAGKLRLTEGVATKRMALNRSLARPAIRRHVSAGILERAASILFAVAGSVGKLGSEHGCSKDLRAFHQIFVDSERVIPTWFSRRLQA